jgi:hypothetical protein
MAAKVTPRLLALMLLAALANAHGQQQGVPRHPYSPIEYLKNYGLSSCLSKGLEGDAATREAAAAAGGYLELGALNIEAYHATATLAEQFLAKKYSGINGEKLTVMKCIDFFHSKELDQLAKKYAKYDAVLKRGGKLPQ